MSSTKRKTLLTVKTDTDTFVLHDFLAALSEFGHIDPYLDFPRERNVFNAPKKPREKSYVYDAVFSKESGFNPKQRRDDRRHDKMIGLSVCREEDAKPVPSKMSSNIGHYLDRRCDPLNRSHTRIHFVGTEFFRRNGVDFKNLMEDQKH
uniref:LAGLIDADG_2 domain-containing protein n=1 Tax=Mesocestoides corti TaxID=53468 RepID=A0A5K3EYR4_MESCO